MTSAEHISSQDTACQKAYEAGQKIRRTAESTVDMARDAGAAAIQETRKHPLRSLFIAAGIGLVAGLIKRKR